jgi:RimJ/RimL family protein N-acetyltransferase
MTPEYSTLPSDRRYSLLIDGLWGDPDMTTGRLRLQSLRVEDAEEMVDVLADPALHEFTGGKPATLDELRDRFESWTRGSGSDAEVWLNWIVRRAEDDLAVGTVQATIVDADDRCEALLAWTVGTAWQRRGYATEAAGALVRWLEQRGVGSIVAHIHPDHVASANIATRAGLRPTTGVVDGEIVWRLDRESGQSV